MAFARDAGSASVTSPVCSCNTCSEKLPDIGNNHWFFIVIGEGSYAALCGMPVGLNNRIGCAQIILNFTIGNKICFENQIFLKYLTHLLICYRVRCLHKILRQSEDEYPIPCMMGSAIARIRISSPLYFRMKPKNNRIFSCSPIYKSQFFL